MIDRLRTWWQVRTGEEDTPFDGDAPAWALSLLVHLGILLPLALATIYVPRTEQSEVVTTMADEPTPIDEPAEEFYFSSQEQEKIGANSVGGTGAALGMAPVVSAESAIPTTALETTVNTPSSVRLREDVLVATGPQFSANLIVPGAAGVGTTGAVGAIDRITHEILLSLEERKTLVVWLFDQSGSLAQQRKQINKRFARIYEELGVVEASGNAAFKRHDSKPLLSAVVAFGKEITFLTAKPTDDVQEIQSAVAGLQTDNSGLERVFTAVYQSVEKYRKYRVQSPRRNIMFVIFSDEVGDDEQGLDATVAMCRKYEIPVYAVGVPAPFGREEALIKWIDPDPNFDREPQWVPVRQGPESMLPEQIKLGFAGSGELDDPMDSGFGPFSLTRLCYETGGIYFAVHPNRNARRAVLRSETAELASQITYFFDPEIMRTYRPDYLSRPQYEKLLQENRARGALVEASMMSWRSPMEAPRLVFPKVDDGELANLLTMAQRGAAALEPKINELHAVLKSGEKDRPKVTQPRWQAGFDLAMGRVIAVKVRTESYNAMLAKAKQGMKFKNPRDDTWILEPANEISVGSSLEKEAQQAKVYLERVVHDHPNTPWSKLAQRELADPLGWKWTERFTGVGKRPPQFASGGNPPPKDDKLKMLKRPPPRRPAPKL